MGEFTEADYKDYSVILLPDFLENPSVAVDIDITKRLNEMIVYAHDNTQSGKIAFASAFFDIIRRIDSIIRDSGNNEKGINYYCKKVEYLIECNYSKKISLQKIAEELNLSAAYLSSVYKAHTGSTFQQQVLNVRMHHADELLRNSNIPTAKVAYLCGFCDESYFRKQFKRFFGINVREFRNIKNGNTLYHEKPTREKYE